MPLRLPLRALVLMPVLMPLAAHAQAPAGPPSVGVVRAEMRPVTETSEFIGRVQAIGRVSLTARVTAFLEQRLFVEGTEVNEGDLLFKLERGPYEAAAQQQEAAVSDASARLANATIQLNRAQQLLGGPAGRGSAVDDAIAAQRSQAAQVSAAQAMSRMAQLNLAYTEIRAPIGGKISRAAVTVGNVVSPSTGALASIVSQDPMHVLFPVATRARLELEKRYAGKGGMQGVIVRLRLSDGTMYGQVGKIDYVDPSVAPNTDTIILRATIANPPLHAVQPGQPVERPLTDGAFVTVSVEGIEPVTALSIPRAAVLSDQQGSFVYAVTPQNKIEVRRIQLGQSTPASATILRGLKEGESIVLEGLQRVRPGIDVVPSPASPGPGR